MDFLTPFLLLIAVSGIAVLIVLTLSQKHNGSNGEETERLRAELRELKAEHAREARANREEMARSIAEVNRTLHGQINEMNDTQLRQVSDLTKHNDEAAERLRLTVDEKLSAMYAGNEKKLEEMRRTVDEKLETTLNQRFGESFGRVNERLEMVNRSLGEIRGLSAELTDMKKIFSNVKTRGVWGEVQLAQILEEILTPDQYVANFSTGAKSEERVEFAVCLPGRDEHHGMVYLPIDSKFPVEDYARLAEAAEAADHATVAECRKALERTLKTEAKMIRDKYIEPPKTLDYGIMFLPTEGLYSEALRLPGFMEYAAEQRVMVTGPTNLAALLNSIKMGFKTLAIEEKSGEIRKMLAMVKTDMAKFAVSLEKAQKKIAEADKTIAEAGHRTELITKRLKNVETSENLLSEESEF
ncbi:MAG: DNA recombination protein RmuC [Firmicutes bacterium]|nr:DNA recombination protein RmuC [Bacillota bacterium]